MARPKATPEQREQIRRGIRQAAAELYRAEGLAAISARSVARKAGVSVGTIYAHFGDLATLMQSLWTGRVDRQNVRFRAIADQIDDPRERLRALLAAYLDFAAENADLYRAVFLFVRPESHPQPTPEPLATYPFPTLLIETVRAGQQADHFIPGPPETLAQILWSGLHGCLALPVNLDRVALASSHDTAGPMLDALMRAVETSH
ncbi:MAG: TetR/AcrR family transcriptional regulator [Pseudomonadota bacterium]